MIKKMERPELVDYKDEIHHPNGFIEDRYMHNEYVEDLEKYVDYLESKLKNNGDLGDVVKRKKAKCDYCDDSGAMPFSSTKKCPICQ